MPDVYNIVKRDSPTADVFSTEISIPHFETRYQYVPLELRELKIWHPWRKVSKENSDRFRKAPVGKSGYLLDVWRDTSAQRTFASVTAQRADGIGIVTGDNLICIDLDGCVLDATQHTLTAFALHVYKQCKSYAEISPSGTGIKIFARVDADVLPLLRSFKGEINNNHVEIESLHGGMFATVTGKKLYASTPETINNISAGIRQIISILPVKDVPAVPAPRPISAPRPSNSTELERNVIENYNQMFDTMTELSMNGCKRDCGNVWHCICGVHTGKDGSLYIVRARDTKYGTYLVSPFNTACVLHKMNRLASDKTKPGAIGSFDTMRYLRFNGDLIAALAYARDQLNQPIKRTEFEYKAPTPIAPAVVAPIIDVQSVLQKTLYKVAGDTTLNPTARKLINLFLQSADDKACIKEDVRRLATTCNVSERSIQRASQELIAAGYIAKYVDANAYGGTGTNIYQLVTDRVTPYFNIPTSVEPNKIKDDVGQVRGGHDTTQGSTGRDTPAPAPARKGAKPKTTANHGNEQPAPRSPLPCPKSIDYDGLTEYVHMLIVDKKYRLMFKSDGQAALWSVKRCTAIVQSVFGEKFSSATIAAAYKAAQDTKNEIKQYIKEIKRINDETLESEIEAKRTMLVSNRHKKTRALESAKLRCAMGEKKYRAARRARMLPPTKVASAA